MDWRAEPEGQARREANSLPADVFTLLIETLGRICEDPFDRLLSKPLRDGEEARRLAELGEGGFIEFRVDREARLVLVYRVVWIG